MSSPPHCKRKSDEAPTSSNKRAKKAEETNQVGAWPNFLPASETYTKHRRFWAIDGNVLLQIGSTRFKVHRSRLASESPWFAKGFDRIPGTTVGDEQEREEPKNKGGSDVDAMCEEENGEVDMEEEGEDEGINDEEAEVNVEDEEENDEASFDDMMIEDAGGYAVYFLNSRQVPVDDFETLLAAMDDAITFYFEGPSFLTVAAILRAAEAFRLHRMSQFARKYVERVFSNNLEDTIKRKFNKEAANYASEAVVLGRDWDLRSILRRTFYELAKRPALGIAENSEEENAHDAIHELSAADVVRLAHGQKQLMAVWNRTALFPALKCPQTADTEECSLGATRLHHWDLVTKPGVLQTFQFGPICGLQKLIDAGWKRIGYCNHCLLVRKASLRTHQEKIWKDMGSWFDVD